MVIVANVHTEHTLTTTESVPQCQITANNGTKKQELVHAVMADTTSSRAIVFWHNENIFIDFFRVY